MIPAVNIGPRERRKRRLLGIAALAVAAAGAAALFAAGAPRWWRAVLLLPLWVAGLGFFQSGAGV